MERAANYWERETPRYRVTIRGGVTPPAKSRFRFEPPFASSTDSNEWQYGERPYAEGEIIETRAWPHASFFPLNESAKQVLAFFKSRQKSRLPLSPWQGDRVRLTDGLGGPQIQPAIVKPEPFDARPQPATGFQPHLKISAA